ncbi:hypothetical protein EVJ58_g4725 [Rhodofomes roseus]|uniref:Uncharacterized protein n=1 Tax=Rhodofomes roseus TaxID=34475 RepID=A0A4Y9YGW5_9APHY|nr:hypothetical protein EVJ58_g4725 [Rhodofomes roseus]
MARRTCHVATAPIERYSSPPRTSESVYRPEPSLVQRCSKVETPVSCAVGQGCLDSSNRSSLLIKEEPSILSSEQQAAIRAAEDALSPEVRSRIENRYKTDVKKPLAGSADRQEGPSVPKPWKGKEVDPRNWGASSIPAEELELEAQRKELEKYSSQSLADKVLEEERISFEEQREALAHWRALKAAAKAVPAGTTGKSSAEPPRKEVVGSSTTSKGVLEDDLAANEASQDVLKKELEELKARLAAHEAILSRTVPSEAVPSEDPSVSVKPNVPKPPKVQDDIGDAVTHRSNPRVSVLKSPSATAALSSKSVLRPLIV